MSFLEELESLRMPFPDIEEATKNFTTLIGKGGYGMVYKGELLLSGKLTTVAVKRLDGNVSGQGFKEFLTEIQLLTRYKHPNLISLIGFCDQDNEKILIYEHAEHGSLDKYLSTAENRSKLTWKRRINICVNAARGLNFLHNEVAPNERVIHRDIKSANVLLDGNWKAMISDLGLSKLGRANEKDTFLITNASGTHGYCDPVYVSSGILTKESDVYSLGVVLFEVLCGRLCFINVNNEHRFLSSLAQSHYKTRKIDEIMDPVLKNQIDSDSLDKFSKIAYQCLQNNRKRRPSMRTVVKKLEELEKALEVQIEPIPKGNLPPGFDPNTCRSLYVGNVHTSVTEPLLQEVFACTGPVEGCKLIRKDKSSCGFIDYFDRRSAALAILSLNGRHLFGQPIKVNWAYASGRRREDISGHFNIFVGDLSPEVTDAMLFVCFSVYASCSDARVMWNKKTGRSRGFGFVYFRDQEDAQSAINNLTGKWLGSRQIRCNWATKSVGTSDEK